MWIKSMRYFMIQVFAALLMLAGTFVPVTAWAGGLNVYEQDVVNQAGGSFEWQGTFYRAKPEFMEMLIEYLCEDEVDLSADTCQSALRKMYDSVEQGVVEGYLYAVSEAEAEALENSPVREHRPAPEGTVAEEVAAYESDKEISDKKIAVTYSDMEETGAAVPAVFEKLMKRQGDMDSLEIQGYGEEEFLASVSKLPDSAAIYRAVYYMEAGGVAVLILVVLTGMAFGLFRKHRRRKLRNWMRKLLAVVMAMGGMILTGLLAFGICFFSVGSMLNQIEKTSYYDSVYGEIKMAAALALTGIGVPADIAKESIPYERVVMDARQQLEAGLRGGEYKTDTSIFRNTLEEKTLSFLLERYPDCGEIREGTGVLLDGVERHYESCLYWAGESAWRQEQERFFESAGIQAGLALALMTGSFAAMLGLSHYKYRAVHMAGYAIGAGAGGCMLLLLFIWGAGNVRTLNVVPVYMKETVHLLSVKLVYAGTLLGAAGICLGAACLYAAKVIRNEVR